MTVIRRYNESTSQWEVVAVGQAGNQGVTGPSGPIGATGPRQSVGTTPPVSPTSGDQWFNSELGRQFVYYDSTWVEVGSAFRGDPGLVASTTAPTDTSVLWLDTDADGDGAYLPAGGASGSVLRKVSATDYDTEWAAGVVTTDVVAAKGNVLSGTGPNAVGVSSVGVDGQMLVADSAQSAGINWRTVPAGDQTIVYPNTIDPINVYTNNTGSLLDNSISVRGICLLKTCLISTMSVYITASSGVGATYRMAIYGNDGFGRPGNLAWDSGPLDGSTIGKKTATGINTWVPAGMIYVGAMLVSGTVTVYGTAGSTANADAVPKGPMGDNLARSGRYNITTSGGIAPANPVWNALNNGGGPTISLELTFSQVIQ